MIVLTVIIFSIIISGCGHKYLPENNCGIKLKISKEKLLDLHNKERYNKGYEKLKLDNNLCIYAQDHANKMANKNYLYHSNMKNLISVNKNTMLVGENIAWGQKNEKEVVQAWMNSRGHRKNILNNHYKKVGFGISKDSKERIYWCVVFSD